MCMVNSVEGLQLLQKRVVQFLETTGSAHVSCTGGLLSSGPIALDIYDTNVHRDCRTHSGLHRDSTQHLVLYSGKKSPDSAACCME